MAIWKEQKSVEQDPVREPASKTADREKASARPPREEPASRPRAGKASESVIAADLTIEGKIEGAGHVRLVGKFKGDVHVKGDLTIEPGAKVTGSVRADKVVVGGELEGNIESASTVELLESGMVNGDLTAGSVTVAPGSRMRGQVQFGWNEKDLGASKLKVETGAAKSTE